MKHAKRVFIFGAGFSKPAGMPLATGLLPLLTEKLQNGEMQEWLENVRERLDWIYQTGGQPSSFALNIEEVFDIAHFDIEVQRLKQHLVPVGRNGPGTPWNVARSITSWLSQLEDALRDVIFEKENQANIAPITRWAETVTAADTVITFNYDTLVERALSAVGQAWNYGIAQEGDDGVAVCKLHGSINWVVASRCDQLRKLNLLFDKKNMNRSEQPTEHVEDDSRLWGCRTPEQLRTWLSGRELQSIPSGASPRTVGIAGLGAYKELHVIPGLGQIWAHGMRAL